MNLLREQEYESLDGQTKKSLEYSILDGVTWMVFFTLTSGVFLVGFALLLGATPFQIGLISSLPFLANASQIIGAYLVENTGKRKSLSVLTSLFSRLLWILIILAPLFIFPLHAAIWLVIIIFAISSILGAIGGIAWLSWMSSIVPKNIMGKFFGKRNTYMGISGVAVGLLGGFFLDYWELNQPIITHAFLILFGFGILFGVFSVLYQRRVHEGPKDGEKVTFKMFKVAAKFPYKDPNFRKFVKFGIFWGFSIGLLGPFLIVYMLEVLELNYMVVVALNTLFVVSSLITLGTWGSVIDKFGAKPVLVICSLIVSLYPFVFIFITKENFFFVALANLLGGIAWGGVDLATFQMLFRISPQLNKSIFFSSFTATTGVAMAVAVIIGGIVANVFANISYSLPFVTLSGLHFLFLLTTITRLFSSGMIQNVGDPGSGNVDEVLSQLKERKLMNMFVNFYHVSQFSLGIVTLPVIYSRKAAYESTCLVRREIDTFRTNSIKALKELEKVTKMSMIELRKIKYGNARKFLPRLNVINKNIKVLEGKAARTKDEKVLQVVHDDIVKVEENSVNVLKKLEATKEITKMPENYMKKMIKLARSVVK